MDLCVPLASRWVCGSGGFMFNYKSRCPRSSQKRNCGEEEGGVGKWGKGVLPCSCCSVYGQPSNSNRTQPAIFPISDSSSAASVGSVFAEGSSTSPYHFFSIPPTRPLHPVHNHPPPGSPQAMTCPNCICIRVMCANFTLWNFYFAHLLVAVFLPRFSSASRNQKKKK